MYADSRSGPLPLAEALVEWSDPALVQTVKDAEKPFSAQELDALDTRFTDRFGPWRRVRGLDPYLKTDADPRVAALFAAWQKLVMGFALLALRGEIVLLGIQTKPSTHPRTIALDVGSQLPWISVRSNTAQQGDRVFSYMTARRAPPDPLDVFREDMSVLPDGRGLELKDALIAWGDLNLLKAVRRIERRIVDVLRNPLKWPRLFDPSQAPAERCALEADEIMAPKEKLGAAWLALLQDARRKIERGEWFVSGAQTFPLRSTSRSPVPNVWAAEFFFDVEANKITVLQSGATSHAYAAVRISRPSGGAVKAAGPAEAAEIEVVESVPALRAQVEPATIESPGRPPATPGRKSDAAVVEAALHRHWQDLELDRFVAAGTEPVWTELGNRLIRRMRAEKRKDPVVRVPALRTVRKHAARMWPRLVAEKAALGRSGQ